MKFFISLICCVFLISYNHLSAKTPDKINLKIDSVGARFDTAKKIQEIAQTIRGKADSLYNIIQNHKNILIDRDGGFDAHKMPLARDNQDIAAKYFIIENDGARGKELKQKMDEYRTFMLSVFPDSTALNSRFSTMLATNDTMSGENYGWVSILVEHLPLAATMANLTLLQTYIRNVEAETVDRLADMINPGVEELQFKDLIVVGEIESIMITNSSGIHELSDEQMIDFQNALSNMIFQDSCVMKKQDILVVLFIKGKMYTGFSAKGSDILYFDFRQKYPYRIKGKKYKGTEFYFKMPEGMNLENY